MRRIALAVCAALLAGGAAAAAEDGAALFRAKCAACHGGRGEGARFAPSAIAGLPEGAVRHVLESGKGKMRPPKGITEPEIAALARYVASLKH